MTEECFAPKINFKPFLLPKTPNQHYIDLNKLDLLFLKKKKQYETQKLFKIISTILYNFHIK